MLTLFALPIISTAPTMETNQNSVIPIPSIMAVSIIQVISMKRCASIGSNAQLHPQFSHTGLLSATEVPIPAFASLYYQIEGIGAR